MASHKLSLVAQFDDILRTQTPLFEYHETEWTNFLRMQEQVRIKVGEDSETLNGLRKQLAAVKSEKNTLEITLEHVRRDLAARMLECEQQAQKIELIKELLKSKPNHSYQMLSEEDKEKLAFLNQSRNYGGGVSPSMMDTAHLEDSLSLLSDSAYDKTGDDLGCTRRRRSKRKSRPLSGGAPNILSEHQVQGYSKYPSAPPESDELEKTPPKRLKRMDPSSDDTDDCRGYPQSEAKPTRRSNRNRMRRSLSVGHPVDDDDADSFFDLDTGRPASAMPRGILKKDKLETPTTPPDSPTIKRWASASKLNRAHALIAKSMIKPEYCGPCGKKIRFGKTAYKCKECRVVCHQECRENLNQLCIPSSTTPNKGTQGNKISDFAPADPPFVPTILLQCVNEVESRGFNEEGLYRKSGSEKEVKELKDRYLRGKDPRLEQVNDIHVVCGCLKDFLRNLKEPLVPSALWKTLTDAADIQNVSERCAAVKTVVQQLPRVNRDCIAFLIIHLQRVSEKPECKMGVTNLAKVFGPTVVGYSQPNPEPMQMIAETRPQQTVMEALIEQNADYWQTMLCGGSDTGSVYYDVATTPVVSQSHAVVSGTAKSVPRTGSKVKQFFGESPRLDSGNRNKSFFPSPMLK